MKKSTFSSFNQRVRKNLPVIPSVLYAIKAVPYFWWKPKNRVVSVLLVHRRVRVVPTERRAESLRSRTLVVHRRTTVLAVGQTNVETVRSRGDRQHGVPDHSVPAHVFCGRKFWRRQRQAHVGVQKCVWFCPEIALSILFVENSPRPYRKSLESVTIRTLKTFRCWTQSYSWKSWPTTSATNCRYCVMR